MRVIKFRVWLPKARRSAWSGDNPPDRRKFGRMIEFDELHFSISDDSLQHPQILTDTPEHFYGEDIYKSQEGAILMQYIGLCDTNGIEIYEGDIVKWGRHCDRCSELTERIAEVRLDPDLQFKAQERIGTFHYGSFAYSDKSGNGQLEHLEIIGNIHQHPEILA